MTRKADDNEPFAALAFKILNDPFVGNLTFFRVYSGTLNSGDQVFVPNKNREERIGRLLQMHASERSEIKEVRAGDIAAAVGLKLSLIHISPRRFLQSPAFVCGHRRRAFAPVHLGNASLRATCQGWLSKGIYGDDDATYSHRQKRACLEVKSPRIGGLAAEARGVHARVYHHAEEAELGPAQGLSLIHI